MCDAIIAAVITGAVSLVGHWLINNKTQAVMQVRLDILERSFAQLDQKVTKHNSMMERLATAEIDIKTLYKNCERMEAKQ